MIRQRASWTNGRVLATLLLVFIAGGAAGAVALRTYYRVMATRSAAVLRADNPKVWLERFRKDLDLTTAQAEKMEIALDDYMKYLQDLQTQMDDVRAHGKQQILRILDPVQQKKFEKMLADSQVRR